jgi:hypothetical protein
MVLMLYASELAALIGRHKYQPAHQAVLKVWRRVDSDSYDRAKLRHGVAVVTDQEREERVNASLTEPPQTQMDVKAFMKTELLRPMFELEDGEHVRAQIENMQKMEPKQREEAIRGMCKYEDVVLPPVVQARIGAEIERASHLDVSDAELHAVCQNIVRMPRIKDCSRTKAALFSCVNKRRGISMEKLALQAYCSAYSYTDVVCPNAFVKVDLDDGETAIGGRVDALRGDEAVVEVKCRQNRFFDSFPDYEYVQIMLYMRLTERAQCDLVQYFDNRIQVQTFEYSESAWEYIAAAAQDFSEEFRLLLKSEPMQDKLLGLIENDE